MLRLGEPATGAAHQCRNRTARSLLPLSDRPLYTARQRQQAGRTPNASRSRSSIGISRLENNSDCCGIECFAGMRQSGLNQVLRPGPTDGVLEQGGPGLDLKLLADVDAVGLDRLRAKAQPFADFMGSQALAHQAKD